jgi:hypothetical protein
VPSFIEVKNDFARLQTQVSPVFKVINVIRRSGGEPDLVSAKPPPTNIACFIRDSFCTDSKSGLLGTIDGNKELNRAT